MSYNVNEEYFDIIDQEEKAYWLGFITADGCVYKNILFIRLGAKDKNHITKFQKAISSNHNIYESVSNFKTDVCSLQIGNKHLVNKLSEYGIVPKKSHIIEPHKFECRKLQTAYWRGIFDGDGSLSKNKKGYSTVSLNGNLKMIEGFKSFLVSEGLVRGSIESHSSIYKFKTAGTKGPMDILDLIYKDSTVYLDRKFERYTEYTKNPT